MGQQGNRPIIGNSVLKRGYLWFPKNEKIAAYARIAKLEAGEDRSVVITFRSLNKYYDTNNVGILEFPIKVWKYDEIKPLLLSQTDSGELEIKVEYPEKVAVIQVKHMFKRSTILKYQGNPIIVVTDIYENIWFDSKQICRIIGIQNITEAIDKIPKQDKVTRTAWKHDKVIDRIEFVTEDGLLPLLEKSTKLKAKAFQKWVSDTISPMLHRYIQ